MPITFPATQPDVGPEAVDKPVPAPARVGSPQSHDIAEPKLDDVCLAGGHYDEPNCGEAIASCITAAQSIRA